MRRIQRTTDDLSDETSYTEERTRRNVIGFLSRCLVAAVALPSFAMTDSVWAMSVLSEDNLSAMSDSASEGRRTSWDTWLDSELRARWAIPQSIPGIAREMGVSDSCIRARATRLGLLSRHRESFLV
jgi:hypothetical protein